MIKLWRANKAEPEKKALGDWWKQIDDGGRRVARLQEVRHHHKPQCAIQRLYN
jgi:acetolactate synthase-1/2/3 large subunit